MVTLSGSFVAYGKLKGIITGKPVALPGGPYFNLMLVILMTAAAVWAIAFDQPMGYWILAAIALVLHRATNNFARPKRKISTIGRIKL